MESEPSVTVDRSGKGVKSAGFFQVQKVRAGLWDELKRGEDTGWETSLMVLHFHDPSGPVAQHFHCRS